jgi:hypothetical protein
LDSVVPLGDAQRHFYFNPRRNNMRGKHKGFVVKGTSGKGGHKKGHKKSRKGGRKHGRKK